MFAEVYRSNPEDEEEAGVYWRALEKDWGWLISDPSAVPLIRVWVPKRVTRQIWGRMRGIIGCEFFFFILCCFRVLPLHPLPPSKKKKKKSNHLKWRHHHLTLSSQTNICKSAFFSFFFFFFACFWVVFVPWPGKFAFVPNITSLQDRNWTT